MYFLPSFKSIDLSVHEKKLKIDFQDLGFLIRTILAIPDLQVTQILPIKFQVKWAFGSGGKAQNRFSRRPRWPPS